MTGLAIRTFLALAVALTALVSFDPARPPCVRVQFKDGPR